MLEGIPKHHDVDKDGNMGIGFCISGPEKYLSHGHTGRLCNDKLGTVRYPIQEVLQSEAPYIDRRAPYFASINSFLSRFNDYSSMQLDPSDGKTFYFYSEYVNAKLSEVEVLNLKGWFTGLHSFCITEGCGKVPTTQGPSQSCCSNKSLSRNKSLPQNKSLSRNKSLYKDTMSMEEFEQHIYQCRLNYKEKFYERYGSKRFDKIKTVY